MTLHRFFATAPVPQEGVLPFSSADVHHVRDVLRLEPGDEIVVAYEGLAWRISLTGVADVVTGVRIGEVASSSLPRVTLVQGLPKGDKMDAIVRQVTELGVSRIVPFAAARSVVKLTAAKAEARTMRWRRVAEEAAKQSQRVAVPEVCMPVSSADLVSVLAGSAVIVCWEEAKGAPGIAQAVEAFLARDSRSEVPLREMAIVIGPEGGLTAEEVESLVASGAHMVSLGGTVLRTETAGVIGPALLLYELGGLGRISG